MPAAAKTTTGAKKLPAVPESKLKLVKKHNSARVLKLKLKLKNRVHALLKKKQNFQRAENYAKEYKKLALNEITQKREAKKAGSYYIPGEEKLAFVIRIRG